MYPRRGRNPKTREINRYPSVVTSSKLQSNQHAQSREAYLPTYTLHKMLDNITFGPIRTVLNTEYATASDNTKWKRKIKKDGTRTVWEAISPPLQPQASPTPLALMLVLESQAEGEPKHWFLFVSREEEEGSVFQVKGDATFMTYTHIRDMDLLSSDDYYTSYTLAYLNEDGEAVVKENAEAQPPPQAANRQLVTENCQGWTIRVLQSLHLAGVIEDKWVHLAKELQEAV